MSDQLSASPDIERPTKRMCRVTAIAMILRENTRHPSGTPRISPDKAHEVAERVYQFLVTEKVVLP